MTAEEALVFIHEKLWQGSKPGLSRTRELLSRMGNPHKELSFIHIAGTNGKGSTSSMLASILQAAGYKTGLYTSPYITCFNERMQVNGQSISDSEFGEITTRLAPMALSMEDRPTEFELVTAVAFEFFRCQNCDLVVLEVGMGGRLDSTNVIESPLCSVITNIGLDHTRVLGETVEKITAEKAAIIKEGSPAVIYDLPENVKSIIENRCKTQSSPLSVADFSALKSISSELWGQSFSYKDSPEYSLSLLGTHQLRNAAVVLETVEILSKKGVNISESSVRHGLSSVKWPARFEIIHKNPYFIVDGGHNPQCAETVVHNLSRYFPHNKKVILLGVLADKDYMGLSRILDSVADFFVCITPPNTRALPANQLAEALKCFGKPVLFSESIPNGIESAISIAGEAGVVCSVGSLYSAREVRAYFGK